MNCSTVRSLLGQFESSAITNVVLWTARVLSGAILSFWLFFIFAHLVGSAGAGQRALRIGDYVMLATMAVSLIGLGLALRWNRLGALVTLIAVAIGAAANWKTLLLPPVLIPIAAMLFPWHSHLAISARHAAAMELR